MRELRPRGKVICLNYKARKCWSQNSKPSSLIPEPQLLTNEKRVYNINLYHEKVKFREKILIKTRNLL